MPDIQHLYQHTNRAGPKPLIPTPDRREVSNHESLVRTPPVHGPMQIHKPHEHWTVPHFNKLYGSMRTEFGWQNVVDNYAEGVITSVAGAQVAAQVSLKNDPHWRLEQWPGGTALFLCIRQFGIAPQTPTFATAGNLDILYQDTIGGLIVPLGLIANNSTENLFLTTLIPTPITDPDIQNIGNILVTLNTGATVGTYNWQLGFSGAYLLPALPSEEVTIGGGHVANPIPHVHR